MPAPDPLPPNFWQPPLAALQAQLGSSPEGLSEAEAEARRRTFGPNLLRPRAERAWLLQFLAHFRNPLVLVLLAASAIAGMLGDMKSFVVITGIVLMSVTLDFFQEYRASRAVEKLRHTVALARHGDARRPGARDSGRRTGSRRRGSACGRRPGAGGWARAGRARPVRQPGHADRRILSGGKARAGRTPRHRHDELRPMRCSSAPRSSAGRDAC